MKFLNAKYLSILNNNIYSDMTSTGTSVSNKYKKECINQYLDVVC